MTDSLNKYILINNFRVQTGMNFLSKLLQANNVWIRFRYSNKCLF